MGTQRMSIGEMCRAIDNARPGSKVDQIQKRLADTDYIVKVNGRHRIEGYISLLMGQYELLKAVNPSLPAAMPPDCYSPNAISRLFGVPRSALGAAVETKADEDGQEDLQKRMTVALERLADHLAPEPPDIVGTPYLAQKLNFTKQWISELIRSGEIPARAIVVGTGNGKPWKFHRHLIDKWIKNR